MAPTATASNQSASAPKPRILVVDDEPTLVELARDVIGRTLPCRIVTAKNLAEAKKILAGNQSIELMLADVHLPDGDGMSLLPALRKHQPEASAIVITGAPSVDGAISALRHGAADFLPKPFSSEHLIDRVKRALDRQALEAKKEKRFGRMRDAIKRLNEARKVVSKKVDLLCNDLITAYGDLSKQLDGVRVQENFRKALAEANDLEQLLCHAMDWVLRQMGYANVAVWLASEDGGFQLGAYMKYTIAGEPDFTEALRCGLVEQLTRDGFMHLATAADVAGKATPGEMRHLHGQTVLAANCTYLGEPLAAVVLFRDEKTPFTDDDAAALKAITPIFATALASIVKRTEGEDGDLDGPSEDEPNPFHDGPPVDDAEGDGGKPPKRKKKQDDADWWKRGEAPPF